MPSFTAGSLDDDGHSPRGGVAEQLAEGLDADGPGPDRLVAVAPGPQGVAGVVRVYELQPAAADAKPAAKSAEKATAPAILPREAPASGAEAAAAKW